MLESGNPDGTASATPPAVVVAGLRKRFGAVEALADVSLTIQRGEFFSLLGPSGCGKTTLLRLIAGLEVPDAGSLELGGCSLAGVPAHRRPVNTVFQSYALFPHLDVWNNVAFGLRMKGVPPDELKRRVGAVLDLVEIAPLARRRPGELSGGQKQRVALARAVVNEPEVLLLDEPLGALDLKLRQQLQVELHALQRRLGITFIHVTHDQEEALALSDRLAVMNAGRLEQVGTPSALYEQPRNRFVAGFLGSCNLLEGRVERTDPQALWVQTGCGRFRCTGPGIMETRRASAGAALTLAIRPEKVGVEPAGNASAENRIAAVVRDVVYTGAETQLTLAAGDQILRAHLLNAAAAAPAHRPGDRVAVTLPAGNLVGLED